MVIFEALFGCHDYLILGKNPIKWKQHPDMTMTVDLNIKHQLKQISFVTKRRKMIHLLFGLHFYSCKYIHKDISRQQSIKFYTIIAYITSDSERFETTFSQSVSHLLFDTISNTSFDTISNTSLKRI